LVKDNNGPLIPVACITRHIYFYGNNFFNRRVLWQLLMHHLKYRPYPDTDVVIHFKMSVCQGIDC
jgi:hypothetical protein